MLRTRISPVLSAIALSGLASLAFAQDASDVSAALKAFDAGDHKAALEVLIPAAESGDALAQTAVGEAYYHARGVDKDFETAAAWYQKAADQGDPEGMVRLANLYVYSEGVDEDLGLAFELMHKAANQGYPEAITDLGWMYDYGYGVKQNYVTALGLYRLAASYNDHFGAANIAYMLASEGQVWQDHQEGAGWCFLAMVWTPASDKQEIDETCAYVFDLIDEADKAAGEAWAKDYLAEN